MTEKDMSSPKIGGRIWRKQQKKRAATKQQKKGKKREINN